MRAGELAQERLHHPEEGVCFCSHPDILRPEQELTVQVGFFDAIHVGYSDVPFFSSTEPN